METQALGDIRIDRIVEFETPIFSPISFFDEATPEALAPHRYWLEPRALDPATGNFVMPVQSYLVRTRHHTIFDRYLHRLPQVVRSCGRMAWAYK